MPLLQHVRRFIRQHRLAASDTRVLVALSGGSDSVALAHVLYDLAGAGELVVVGAAHFNHQLRPDASRDEACSADLARSFGWAFLAGREDVARLARERRQSVEVAARSARLAFLERARQECGADVVALGHTRDDQAETFLLRLVRGAGPRGLAAMHPRHDHLVRPLLDCRRADLRAWLQHRGATWVDDPSNADVGIPRNRVRVELVPLLERRFNPRVTDALAAQAELARDEWTLLDAMAREAFEAACLRVVTETDEPRCELDLGTLGAFAPALRRLVLWRALTLVAAGRPVAFAHVETAMAAVRDGCPAPIDFPGQRLQRIGAALVLTGRPPGATGRPRRPQVNLFRYPLSIPGEVRAADGRWTLTAEAGSAAPPPERSGLAVAVAAGAVGDALAVRNRRPGDRFRPVGLGGWKKVQDLFVDRKVPRPARDGVPIVVDAAERIVWVAGHGLDEAFRVTDPTQAVVILRFKPLGGLA